MMMKFVGRGKVEMFENPDEVPYECCGKHRNYEVERSLNLCVPRAELDDQPEYKGWLGPMWDGGMLRYETQEVYDMLSR